MIFTRLYFPETAAGPQPPSSWALCHPCKLAQLLSRVQLRGLAPQLQPPCTYTCLCVSKDDTDDTNTHHRQHRQHKQHPAQHTQHNTCTSQTTPLHTPLEGSRGIISSLVFSEFLRCGSWYFQIICISISFLYVVILKSKLICMIVMLQPFWGIQSVSILNWHNDSRTWQYPQNHPKEFLKRSYGSRVSLISKRYEYIAESILSCGLSKSYHQAGHQDCIAAQRTRRDFSDNTNQ